jgi:hypothetical protein
MAMATVFESGGAKKRSGCASESVAACRCLNAGNARREQQKQTEYQATRTGR